MSIVLINLTILFISNNLAVVERISDRIAAMYQGKIIEEASADFLISAPYHPYAKSLLASVLEVEPGERTITRSYSIPIFLKFKIVNS